MTLAEKIQKLRKEAHLSQDQLAAELGVSRQSVSKWELGDSLPDVNKILQLSGYFQVSTDYLLHDDWETDQTKNSSGTIPQKEEAKNEETEDEPVPASKGPVMTWKKFIRWLLAIILIIVFTVTLFFHFGSIKRIGITEVLILSSIILFKAVLPIWLISELILFLIQWRKEKRS